MKYPPITLNIWGREESEPNVQQRTVEELLRGHRIHFFASREIFISIADLESTWGTKVKLDRNSTVHSVSVPYKTRFWMEEGRVVVANLYIDDLIVDVFERMREVYT